MGLRTLIVDDHEILGAGLACMLAELGHEVLDLSGRAKRRSRARAGINPT